MNYANGNFPPIRLFRDLAELNAQVHWALKQGGLRIHGTIFERPLEHFAIDRPLGKVCTGVSECSRW